MHVLFYDNLTKRGLYTMQAEEDYIQSIGLDYIEIPPEIRDTMKSPEQYMIVDNAFLERPIWKEGDLRQRRQEAVLPKLEFLKRARNAGYITQEEALTAAKGDLPETMAEAFQGMPQDVQDDAAMEWAASSQIERLHPVLLALAAAKNIGSEQLDELFGIVP